MLFVLTKWYELKQLPDQVECLIVMCTDNQTMKFLLATALQSHENKYIIINNTIN